MLTQLRIYAAIGAAVAVLSLVAWCSYTVRGWQRDAARLPAVTAERDRAQAETAQVRATAERERIRADNAVRSYTDEVDQNRRRERPSGPVRLCVQPAPADVPAAGRPAVSAGTAAPAAGELPRPAGGYPAGRDIGPDLRQLADDADAVTAQCRALIGWTAAQPP